MNDSDTSNVSEDWRDESLAICEIAILAIILTITILGNSLVLFAIYLRHYRKRRRRLTRMHFFVMHLSIADLLTGIFNVLPQLVWDISFRFPGGPISCKLVKYIQPLGSYLSSYVLVATAVDRYHAICYPLSYCQTTSRRSRITVYGSWLLAWILCLPQLFVFSYQEIEHGTGIWDCWATFTWSYGEKIYVTWYSFTVFLIPFIVLTFTYTSICCSIRRNRQVLEIGQIDSQNLSRQAKNQSSLISKAKINTIKQTLIVVILYAASSIPFIGCQLWVTWNFSSSSFLTGPVFTILALLSSLTSCVNPWIYLTFSYELRVALTKSLRKMIQMKDRSSTFDRASANVNNSNDTKSSKRSSLISRVTRYTSVVISHANPIERNHK